jgi:hypothetical protein
MMRSQAMLPMLGFLPDGTYVAYGSFAFSGDELFARPLESFVTLARDGSVLVFEGSFSRMGGPKQGITLEIEIAKGRIGEGYFLVQRAGGAEIKGVMGATDKAYLFTGRSQEPPMQLAAHLVVIDENNISLEGLIAYEDFQWATWSVSVKTYDPQVAKSSVLPLRRA